MINKTKLTVAGGFTLIETMIAVLLLATAIAGPLTIASKGLSSSLTAKDQVGAFYLAQDAIEYVRFKRDTNKLGGAPWLTGIVGSGLCSADGTVPCYVDTIQDTLAATSTCPTSKCVLNYDATNHYYSYTTGTRSPESYVRTITMTNPVGGNAGELAVTVTVWWTGAGGTHSIFVRENLFDK